MALGSLVLLPAYGADPVGKPVIIEVSDVKLADKPLRAKPAAEILAHPLGDEIEAFSPVGEQEWVALPSFLGHPFIAAAHLAFKDHRPLAISPDMIWQLITQMAADEVCANPERYREYFAIHERGGRILEVRRDEFVPGHPDNGWPAVFTEFEGQIVKKVPGSPAGDFSHKFSTSTSTETAARSVVLLAAASPFYDYHLATWCGIPRIELHGTEGDWRWIRSKVGGMGRFHMERRVKALKPVLDEFVAASQGKADPVFWKSFYKFASESGASYVSGWINVFFVPESDKLLDVVLDRKFSWTAPPDQYGAYDARNLPLAMKTFSYKSSGITHVDFVWDYLGTSMPMLARAGFMGVAQDRQSLTLKPVIAWQVLRVKQSTEERLAIDHLSRLERLGVWEIKAIQQDFVFEPESGKIRCQRWALSRSIDSRFWRKVFPLMDRLETIDARRWLPGVGDPVEREALCEAMLSAPSVTKVLVHEGLSLECRRILGGRTDWKIETVKED